MTLTYYSLIRFVPDALRDEARNIGVVLYTDDARVRASAFIPDLRGRVRGLADSMDSDLLGDYVRHLRRLFPSPSQRELLGEPQEALQYLASLREGGTLVATEARPAQAASVTELLNRLYQDLVVPRALRAVAEPPRSKFVGELAARFKAWRFLGRSRLQQHCEISIDGIRVKTSFGRWSDELVLLIDALDLSLADERLFKTIAATHVKFCEVKRLRPDAKRLVVARMPEGGQRALPPVEARLLEAHSELIDFDSDDRRLQGELSAAFSEPVL